MFSLFKQSRNTLEHQPTPTRLRILHLGFEDFRKPGSGGGSIRTHEISRRIAKDHDITVLVTRYRGSVDRIEDGVRYIHIGLSLGYFGSILTYFLALPFAAHRQTADLVVEDFAAPFSSCLSPLWIRKRHVAMVQWLNAKGKSQQYHLPFWITEKIGTRLHQRYIAVSGDLAKQIEAQNHRAEVTVIGNGVEQAAFHQSLGQKRQDILFVGRLEREQKGIDLLLNAYSQIANRTDAQLVLVGNGPDEQWVKNRVAELGLGDRVVMKGRVEGSAKDALFTQAKVVAMPSRYETFGMVAIEGLAGGAPVVAFAIPCLREVVPSNLGTLVPAFDSEALGSALLEALQPKASRSLEQARRDFAAHYDWDVLAAQQQAVYEQIAKDLFVPVRTFKRMDPTKATLTKLFVSLARRHSKQSKRARVALAGNYGNGNTGDEAILASLYEIGSPYVDFTVLARNAKAVQQIHGITAIKRISLSGIKTLLGCDVLAIGGGGMFGEGMPLLVRLLPAAGLVLSLLGKDVVFVAIGADPAMPAATARVLRLLGRRAFAVTVRDSKTATFFGARSNPILVDDPAIALKPASIHQLKGITNNVSAKQRLLISLKPTPDADQNRHQINEAAKAADWWVEHTGFGVDFLCLSVNGDFGYGATVTDKTMAQAAIELTNHQGRMKIVGPNLPPRIAKGIIAHAAGVIGARFHALVFAHATNVPAFGMVFETKSRTFQQSVGGGYVELSEPSSDGLYAWLRSTAKTTKKGARA